MKMPKKSCECGAGGYIEGPTYTDAHASQTIDHKLDITEGLSVEYRCPCAAVLTRARNPCGGEKCEYKRQEAVDPDRPGVAYLGEEVLEHDGIYHTTCNNVRKSNQQAWRDSTNRNLHPQKQFRSQCLYAY